jgi:hypothetical protein
MDTTKELRKHLVNLLTGEGAHAGFDAAVKDVPADVRGKCPAEDAHSPWELVEHLRIAQWDILEFSRNPKHVSPKWPEGYWPDGPVPPKGAWERSVAAFQADLKAMAALVSDERTDLIAPIPHGNGQTILREALLVADHNSYHIGQLVLALRLVGAWH